MRQSTPSTPSDMPACHNPGLCAQCTQFARCMRLRGHRGRSYWTLGLALVVAVLATYALL